MTACAAGQPLRLSPSGILSPSSHGTACALPQAAEALWQDTPPTFQSGAFNSSWEVCCTVSLGLRELWLVRACPG